METLPAWYPDPVAQRWWDGSKWTAYTRLDGDVGLPGPVADSTGQPRPGWYADPMVERWWDGTAWAGQTRSRWAGETVPLEAVAAVSVAVSGPRGRRRGSFVIAAVAAVVALGATAVFITRSGSDASEVADTTLMAPALSELPADVVVAPSGALPVVTTGGLVRVADGSATTVSVASCPGLLAAVSASSCTEIADGEDIFALTLSELADGVDIRGYRLSTDGDTITAVNQLEGNVELPESPDTTITVEAFNISSDGGSVAAVVASSEVDGVVSSQVEFFDAADGSLRPAAILNGGGVEIAAIDEAIFVVFDRDASTRRAETLYPVPDGWMTVSEVLDVSVTDARLADGAPIPNPIEVTIRTAAAPTTTSAVVPTTSGDTGRLVDGAEIPCDGSWITIVGSRPLEQVAGVLDRNPGARAVKNLDACPSLNPTFGTGTFAGQPIFVIFYGPYYFLDDARGACNDLGFTTMNDCFVAPLTFDAGDRSVRYGPL